MYEEMKAQVEARKNIYRRMPKPVPVCFIGEGKAGKAAEILQMYDVARVLVITDQPLRKLGLLDPMLEGMEAAGISVAIFDGVEPDPTFALTEQALEFCLESKSEAVVAFGGGSVIDTAKVVSVCGATGQKPFELAGMMKASGPRLPFVAVPTTAGTGSETTTAAAISMTDTHRKVVIADPNVVPDCAILDAGLTVGLPKHITAFTAMDALTHAIEAYVSLYATPDTDRAAKVAIKLIYENLEKVYRMPGDVAGREALLIASFYGGMAFTRTMVGYVHAFAHTIGGAFGVPHGLANAVLLAPVMEWYLPECQSRLAELFELVRPDAPGMDEKRKAEGFIESIVALSRSLEIPKRLEKFPASAISDMCSGGFQEAHGTYPIPRYLTVEEGELLLRRICAE